MDRVLAAQPLKVPVMLVASLWDQEDIYGALAVYKAIKPKDTTNDKVFLTLGPWYHGQEIGDGSTLGALKFSSDTGLHFRREILRPFLDHYLKDAAPDRRYSAGLRIRDWDQRLAPPASVAGGVRNGLHHTSNAALPNRRAKAELRRTEIRRPGVRRIYFRPSQAGAVSRTAHR